MTQTQESTGTEWLTTQAVWNASNEITAAVDARGKETDYTYDANGNTLSVEQPSVSTSLGNGRPTARYTYDQFNNLISYCDPNYVWTTGVTTCGAVPGATYYVYNYSDTNEPFGQLTDSYAPLGYHHRIAYDTSVEGGDFGLPTSVVGDSYQQDDGSTRTPTQTFIYDAYGDLTAFNKGNGSWALAYDIMHRPLTREDPDGVTSYTCYNADGSVAYTESGAQHGLDGSPSACQHPAPAFAIAQSYDPDGNVLAQMSQFTRTAADASTVPAGKTDKWYDGDDRLVEVRQPYDSSYDAYAFPWMTRYIYDVTASQPVSINGGATGFLAHGNLYKTQECIAGTQVTLNQTSLATGNKIQGPCSFQDVRGNTFDALDRAPGKYEVSIGANAEATVTYDAAGNEGLPAVKTTGTGQADTLSYDNAGRLTQESFNDGTPPRNYTYDPDGRRMTEQSATFGTESYAYDEDGDLTNKSEPGGLPYAGQISYAYYPDGLRKALSLQIPALGYSQSNLFEYNYRADGARSSLVAATNPGGTFSWTYSNAGRMLTESDPLTGQSKYVPRSFTYDAYGQIATFTLPSGDAASSFSYDAAGEPTNYTFNGENAGQPVTQAVSQIYSVRGELVTTHGFPPTANSNIYPYPAEFSYANGVQCSNGMQSCTFDSRSGALAATSNGLPTLTHAYVYDAAGRETSDNTTDDCGNETRSYDADNHIIQMSGPAYGGPPDPNNCNGVNYQPTYTWGPDGHLATSVTVSGNSIVSSYHWDGDTILYQVGPSYNGTQLEIDIEKIARVVPIYSGTGNMLVIDDRDWTGTQSETHTIAGWSALEINGQNVLQQMLSMKLPRAGPDAFIGGTTGLSSAQPSGPTGLSAIRSDGYFDGLNSFQGVRAYDPNMNQWTTPDAYAGNVTDPMSQKPYMWNGNNPVSFSDPSGYAGNDRDLVR